MQVSDLQSSRAVRRNAEDREGTRVSRAVLLDEARPLDAQFPGAPERAVRVGQHFFEDKTVLHPQADAITVQLAPHQLAMLRRGAPNRPDF